MNFVDIIKSKKNLNELSREQLEFIIEQYVNNKISNFELGYFFSNITDRLTEKESLFLIDILSRFYSFNLSMSDTIKVGKLTIGKKSFNEDIMISSLVKALDKEGDFYFSFDHLKNEASNNIHIKQLFLLEEELSKVNDIHLLALFNFSKIYKSSILNFVVDIKVGTNSNVKTLEDAIKIGNLLIKYGKQYNKKIVCVVTDAEECFLDCLNLLEISDLLESKQVEKISKIVITIGTYMASIVKEMTYEEAYQKISEMVENGQAYTTFVEFLHKQGVDLEDNLSQENVCSIKSKETGFINNIHYNKLLQLVDDSSKIRLTKKLYDYVLEDEEIIKIYLGDKDVNVNDILNCFEINMNLKETKKVVYGVIK